MDTESDPVLSYLLSSISNLTDDRNCSKPKRKKRKNEKNHRKYKKKDLSESSLSDYDSSNKSNYRRKKRKTKIHRKKYPIKSCTRLTEKLLMTAYKYKIIKFKMDEDPL